MYKSLKVKDLYMALFKGIMVVQDKEGNEICKIYAGSTIKDNYKILEENEVLDEEVYYIEVIKYTMYVTIH